MDDGNLTEDTKHKNAEGLSPQVAFEDQEAESMDIDAAEEAFGRTGDDNGPHELSSE